MGGIIRTNAENAFGNLAAFPDFVFVIISIPSSGLCHTPRGSEPLEY